MLRVAVLFTSLVVLAAATPALGATQQAGPDEAASTAVQNDKAAEQALLDASRLLEDLAKSEKSMSEDMAGIVGQLERYKDDIRNAEAVFDRMVEAITRQAELGKPDGAFVTQIDDLINLARQEAASARDANDATAGEAFEREAQMLEAARKKAIEIYGDSFREIRSVEAQRNSFVRAIKLRRFEQARGEIDRGLKLMEGFRDRIMGVRESIPNPEGLSQ